MPSRKPKPSCPDLLLSSDGELDGICFPCPANGCAHIETRAARRGCVHRVRDKDGKRWNCASVTAQKEAMVRKARAYAGFVKIYPGADMRPHRPGPLVKHILRNEKGKAFDVLKYQCNKEGCDWSDWDDSGKCAWRDLENPDLCDCDEAIIEALKGVIRQARADLAYLKEADDQ